MAFCTSGGGLGAGRRLWVGVSAVEGDDACGAAVLAVSARTGRPRSSPGLFVAREPPVVWRRRARDIVRAKQVGRPPAEDGGLLAPPRQEGAAIGDGLLPTLDWHELGTAGFESGHGAIKATEAMHCCRDGGPLVAYVVLVLLLPLQIGVDDVH